MHFYIWYKSSFDYLVTCYQTHIAFLDLWNPKIGIIIDLKIPHTYIWCKERTEMLWIYCGKIFLQQYHYHLDTNVIFLKHHLETDAKDVRQSLSIALGMMCVIIWKSIIVVVKHLLFHYFVVDGTCFLYVLKLLFSHFFFPVSLPHTSYSSYTTLVYRMVYAVCGVYTERKREIAAVNYQHILLLLR